jgi:predicted outer membrane repeat protein
MFTGTGNVRLNISGDLAVQVFGSTGAGETGATIDGGGAAWLFSVSDVASLHVANVTLRGGFLPDSGTVGGAALSVIGAASVLAEGVRFLSNTAGTDGGKGGGAYIGGIRSGGWPTARFSGCLFKDNAAGKSGGGISVEDAPVHLSDCTFDSNVAGGSASSGYGGGLRLQRGGNSEVASLTRCLFVSNTAGGYGGGVFVYQAVAIFVGCSWHTNIAVGSGSGGGLGLYGTPSASVVASYSVLQDCSFISNAAASYGGGVWVHYTSPNFVNCSWERNHAAVAGGLLLLEAANLTLCVFDSNTADYYGGGTHAQNCDPVFCNSTWRLNTAGDTSSGDGKGAGLSLVGGAAHLIGSLFDGNIAGQVGSGIFAQQAAPIIENCTYIKNGADDRGSWVPSASGGVFRGGAAIYFQMDSIDGQRAKLFGCVFERNCGERGGGCFMQATSPAFYNCTWTSNVALLAGAMYLYGPSMVSEGSPQPTLTLCLFQSNIAFGNGGGLQVDLVSPVFENCTWVNNSAGNSTAGTARGGALNIFGAAAEIAAVLRSCLFRGNSAGHAGGGLYVTNNHPRCLSCTWIDNRAGIMELGSGRGGGLYLSGMLVGSNAPGAWLTLCIFKGNLAGSGGGTCVQYHSPRFERSTWAQNRAKDGGALTLLASMQEGATLLSHCSIVGNSAHQSGGGLSMYEARRIQTQEHSSTNPPALFQVDACRFAQNTAGSQGGAGRVVGVTETKFLVQFTSCNFDRNQAGDSGGALSMFSSNPAPGSVNTTKVLFLLQQCVFHSNVVLGSDGGAVEAIFPPDTPANLKFHTGCVQRTPCEFPDLVSTPPSFVSSTHRQWTRSALLQCLNVSFHSNSATGQVSRGGAVAVSNGALSFVNTSLENNVASKQGGALFLTGTAALRATATFWTNNRVLDLNTGEGAHIYANAGSGEWKFAGLTGFVNADADISGLYAAQIDGSNLNPAVVQVTCPAGSALPIATNWVKNFTSQSDVWVLRKGTVTEVATNATFDFSTTNADNTVGKWLVGNSTPYSSQRSACEVEYFQNCHIPISFFFSTADLPIHGLLDFAC